MIEIPQIIRQTFGPHLKILNISSNYLEILPLEICYLTGLEFLYLRKNHLKKVIFGFTYPIDTS
jgi:Leucine-rich repeat (LRR) protein